MNLRRAREIRDLSQEELAELAGTTRATISLTERGKTKPQKATREKIESALDMVIDWPTMRPGLKKLADELSPDEFVEQELAYILYRELILHRRANKKRIIELLRQYLDFFEEELEAEEEVA